MKALRWFVMAAVLVTGATVARAEQGLSLSVAAGPAHDTSATGSVGSAGVVRVGWRFASGFEAMAVALPLIDLVDEDAPSHAFGAGARTSCTIGAWEPYLEASALAASDGPAALVGGGIGWMIAPQLRVGLFADALIGTGPTVILEGLELVRQF